MIEEIPTSGEFNPFMRGVAPDGPTSGGRRAEEVEGPPVRAPALKWI